MKTMRLCNLPAVLLFVLGAFMPAASAMEVSALLDKVAVAYGINTLADGVKGIRQTGRTFSSMRQEEGPILRTYQHPDRLRIEIRYPGSEEIRVLNGSQAWKQNEPITGSFHAAMILQAARMALPWSLQKDRSSLRDLGTLKFEDGKNLQVLEQPLGIGLVMRATIDTDTGRILRSVGRMTGNMGIMEFGTIYEDFRKHDGLLYAATERHFAMNQATGYTHIDKIEFVDALPETLFLPDGKAAAKTRI